MCWIKVPVLQVCVVSRCVFMPLALKVQPKDYLLLAWHACSAPVQLFRTCDGITMSMCDEPCPVSHLQELEVFGNLWVSRQLAEFGVGSLATIAPRGVEVCGTCSH